MSADQKVAGDEDRATEPVSSARVAPGQPRRSWGVQRRGYMVLLLGVSVLVAVLSLLSIGASDSALRGETFAPSLVAILWLVCYLFASYRAFGTAYLFSAAYIVCLFVFHFGLLIQDGFGVVSLRAWQGLMGSWAVRAGWYANLGFACLGIGISAYVLVQKFRAIPPAAVANRIAQQNIIWLYDCGIGLLVASVVLLLGAFATYGNLLALTRLELFHFSDTRFVSVFSMMVPSAATALLVGARTRRQRLLSYGVAAFVILFFLLAGQRTAAFFPVVAAAVMWVKVGRRINPLLAGAAILGALLLIPIVGYLRTIGTYGDITNAEAISRAAEYADIGAAFGEMGGSIGPLMYTVMLIPDEESYRFGSTYLSYVLDALPNIGLQADQSTSRAAAIELLRSKGEQTALLNMGPGDWASYHIIPEQFIAGGGAGYSGIAEPYFNFGIVGILVFFIALGAFLGKMDCIPLLLYRNWLIAGAAIYWHLLPTVRNDFSVFVKPTVFTIIVLLIWGLVRRFLPMGKAQGPMRAGASGGAPSKRG